MSFDVSELVKTHEKIHSTSYRTVIGMEFCVAALVPFLIAFFIPIVWGILIWLALAVCTVAWGKRLAGVSLQIDDDGVVVRNFFRCYAIKWIAIRSIEIDDVNVPDITTHIVIFETRTHGRIPARASTVDGLMPALYALAPVAELRKIHINMSSKTRLNFEKYCKKRAAAEAKSVEVV